MGSELVWWDARADAAVNDMATVATTQDAGFLYWAYLQHVGADPVSLPMVQIAIDVGPGGETSWQDPNGNLRGPGHCSASTGRACTSDADCHFCTLSTEYTGTADERPRVCGSTFGLDSCDPNNPADVCQRVEICEELSGAPTVPNVGLASNPATGADYLLVFDSGRFLVGFCDSFVLLRHDGSSWVEIPRPVPDPFCPRPTWRFSPIYGAIIEGGPPPGIEVALDWAAFDCQGCTPFRPGDCFRWTVEVNRDLFDLDYLPSGPIEDAMGEAVAGTTTRTLDSCPGSGPLTTHCELADGSTDAYVSSETAFFAGGRVDGLTLARNTDGATPSITLDWNPSCSPIDTEYEVHEGRIGTWYDHAPLPGLCSTAGATTATFDAGPADHYYLVVPSNGFTAGSYGVSSAQAERPPATPACLPQQLGNCP